jgi:hypothetical protein
MIKIEKFRHFDNLLSVSEILSRKFSLNRSRLFQSAQQDAIIGDLTRNLRIYSSHWDRLSVKKLFQQRDMVPPSSILILGTIKK